MEFGKSKEFETQVNCLENRYLIELNYLQNKTSASNIKNSNSHDLTTTNPNYNNTYLFIWKLANMSMIIFFILAAYVQVIYQ